MLGWINLSIEAFVCETFGKDAWAAVLEKSHEASGWVSSCPYPDEITFSLVVTAASMLNITPEEALEAYGRYFVSYVNNQGYDKLLKCLGSNLVEFLQSLNDFHLHLGIHFKNISAPNFRCAEVTSTSMELHYFSERVGLWPIVSGMLKSIGPALFHQKLEVELIKSRSKGDDHEVFLITYEHQENLSQELHKYAENAGTYCMPAEEFSNLFPFHIILDKQCRIVQFGSVIGRVMPQMAKGKHINEVFKSDSHVSELTWDVIASNLNMSFKLTSLEGSNLIIKGQMVVSRMPSALGCPVPQQVLLFLGSPRLASLDQMHDQSLSMSDLPLHDTNRDFVLLAEHRQAEAGLMERFEMLNAELQLANEKIAKTCALLEEECIKSDTLLYSMLPNFVADKMRAGEVVEVIEYEEVAILFSDIVGFTEISAKSSSREVCAMLNELYSIFDFIISEYPTLYKVDTIGDAYMVVSNVVEQSTTHTDDLLDFAIQMQQAARTVNTSIGDFINIRVGIHSGPTVGSVVGAKMPRFTFFGDTVNTASRMESHGLPSKIHISSAAYEAVRNKDRFAIKDRGMINVKGKGDMRTYLIATDNSDFDDVSFLMNSDDMKMSSSFMLEDYLPGKISEKGMRFLNYRSQKSLLGNPALHSLKGEEIHSFEMPRRSEGSSGAIQSLDMPRQTK